MNYANEIRVNIEGLSEEDAKEYLGEILVKFASKDQPLIGEQEYVDSIRSVLKSILKS